MSDTLETTRGRTRVRSDQASQTRAPAAAGLETEMATSTEWPVAAADRPEANLIPGAGAQSQVALGAITHVLVGHLAAACRALPEAEVLTELWSAAGRLATTERFGRRARAARMSAAGAAAVYHRYFLPPPDWALAGAEVGIEGGRVDLVWEHPDGTIVYDELKLAFGRSRATGTGATDRQVRRYLAHGEGTHGEHFGGVRLVRLGAPRHSMLVGPGSRLQRLADTALWFARDTA